MPDLAELRRLLAAATAELERLEAELDHVVDLAHAEDNYAVDVTAHADRAPETADEMLTAHELAALVGVKEHKLYRLAKRGQAGAFRYGERGWRFTLAGYRAWQGGGAKTASDSTLRVVR